jgi:hypothetical protein
MDPKDAVRQTADRYGAATSTLQFSTGLAGLLYKARLRVAFLSCTRDDTPRFSRPALQSAAPNVLTEGECRMSSRILSGVALAAAAAVMFSTVAVSTAVADEAKVKCEGVNSCKGHSACKSANNACKGQNSCKGKGFMEMTQAQCDAAKAKAGK